MYDVVTTGQLVSPAYDHLYRLETAGYAALGYHADWGIEDPRYLLQNLGIALFGAPDLLPTHLPDALGLDPIPVCTDRRRGPRAVRRRLPAGRAARYRDERAADEPGLSPRDPGARRASAGTGS